MEKPEIAGENKFYFEDLPNFDQETIVDLLVNILKNKRQDTDKVD